MSKISPYNETTFSVSKPPSALDIALKTLASVAADHKQPIEIRVEAAKAILDYSRL